MSNEEETQPKMYHGRPLATIASHGYTETVRDFAELPELEFLKGGCTVGTWRDGDYDITVATGETSFDIYPVPPAVGKLIAYMCKMAVKSHQEEISREAHRFLRFLGVDV